MDWVDKTLASNSNDGSVTPVNAYAVFNVHAGYAFSGRWQGWEAGVTAFNFADNRHYELPGPLGGELLRARWTGTLAYRF